MTGPDRCFVPIPALIYQINEHLKGWGNYFGAGYPRKAFRQINCFVQERLIRHLKRRSQRPLSAIRWGDVVRAAPETGPAALVIGAARACLSGTIS
jgi:hypothetical protein